MTRFTAALAAALILGVACQSGSPNGTPASAPRIAGSLDSGLIAFIGDQGVGVIAYNPLAGGFLSGKYQQAEADPPTGTRFTLGKTGELYRERYWKRSQFEAVKRLDEYLRPRGQSLTRTAIAWVLARPGVTAAIVGASRPEQLDDTVAGADAALDAETRAACDLAWLTLPRQEK